MPQISATLFHIILSLIALNLLVAGCCFRGGFDDQQQSAEAAFPIKQQVTPSVALCKTDAREVLKKSCGKCHQKSISRVPKALNVYDLEEDVWYSSMSKSQLKGLKKRIRKAANISKKEVNFVDGCVSCLLSDNCRKR
jgi:cytochrome c5